jgi:hypothetical protein
VILARREEDRMEEDDGEMEKMKAQVWSVRQSVREEGAGTGQGGESG